MLKIITCEFAKLKRKKFVSFVILSALLFPIPLTLVMTMPQMVGRYDSKTEMFNEYYTFVMGYGIELLLPCVIGILAAMLFFMERDNDTFKSLRTIPVTSTQMVFAKIIVLFLFGILFSVSLGIVAALCGSLAAEVNGLAYKWFLAVEMGIFTTAGTMPLVILVVFFSKTYIFSVLLCIFYSVLSLIVETFFGVLPKAVCHLMPIPLTTLWCAGDLVSHGVCDSLEGLEYLVPSTLQTMVILSIMALLSVMVIVYLYKKRGEE